ncbi:unnamed protein product [Phytophthora lilii]|uniref:Unnamed protein product n=1 Tax=Phytophthora lilii TaxID=2077276 RepID=A0A9W6U4D3_9STRA|nr:unnamed protein product [Phytophthora lilii]
MARGTVSDSPTDLERQATQRLDARVVEGQHERQQAYHVDDADEPEKQRDAYALLVRDQAADSSRVHAVHEGSEERHQVSKHMVRAAVRAFVVEDCRDVARHAEDHAGQLHPHERLLECDHAQQEREHRGRGAHDGAAGHAGEVQALVVREVGDEPERRDDGADLEDLAVAGLLAGAAHELRVAELAVCGQAAQPRPGAREQHLRPVPERQVHREKRDAHVREEERALEAQLVEDELHQHAGERPDERHDHEERHAQQPVEVQNHYTDSVHDSILRGPHHPRRGVTRAVESNQTQTTSIGLLAAMASCSAAAPSSASSAASSSALAAQPSAGLLSVEVLGARNLPPAVLGSLLKWTPSYANPYVVLSLDRERFVSSVRQRDLNPSWKETGRLNVPLPSETEVLQTVGVPGGQSVGAGGKGSAKGKGGGAVVKKKGAAAASADAAMGYRQYYPCAPELYVQVFHRADEAKDTPPAAAAPASNSSTSSHVSALGPEDKLIGAVVVPLLPCLMSSASSSRGWYQLTDEESQSAGQLQLSLNFDVSAASNELEPRKGDIIRLTGFGGLEYYSKLLSPSARLEVLDIFQDQVFAQTYSQEGWPLSFELHRNLVHVERRPSLLHDASEQLQNQVTRVRHFRVVTGAQRVWRALPDTPRIQFENSAAFAAFFGAQAYSTMMRSVTELVHSGVYSGVQTFVASSKDAYGQVKHEFVRVYWSAPRRVTSGGFDGGYDDDLIDCGPRTNRGHIVRAFTPVDRLAVDYEDHAEEEMMMRWETYEDSEDYEDEVMEDEGEPAVPEQLICPITGCPMMDPVVAADGHSYEREAILQWFTSSDISPMTGMHMPTKQVFSNFTLRQLSEEVQAAATRRQHARRFRHRRQSATPFQETEQVSKAEDDLEDKAASSEGSQE